MIRTGEEDAGKGKGRGKSDHLAEMKECENDRQDSVLEWYCTSRTVCIGVSEEAVNILTSGQKDSQ